jgi:aminotransferase
VALDPDSEVAVFQGSHIGVAASRARAQPGQYLISTDPCYPIYRSAALQSQAVFTACRFVLRTISCRILTTYRVRCGQGRAGGTQLSA